MHTCVKGQKRQEVIFATDKKAIIDGREEEIVFSHNILCVFNMSKDIM